MITEELYPVEDRAVMISDLIEQIIKVDELLKIHQKYEAHPVETEQILTLRKEFTHALNELLQPYDLELVGKKIAV